MFTHTVSVSAATLNTSKLLKGAIYPFVSRFLEIFRLLCGTVLLRGGL